MEEELLPVEDEINRYLEIIEPRDTYGLNEICRHLDRMGYKYEKWYIIKILNGWCQEGHSVFLGWHGSHALYKKMD